MDGAGPLNDPTRLGLLVHPLFALTTGPGAIPDVVVRLDGLSRSSTRSAALLSINGGPAEWLVKPKDVDDLAAFLRVLDPDVPVLPVGVGSNQPGKDPGADGEVRLDIEIAGAVAPGAAIVVYFSDPSDRGFYDALSAAVSDTTHAPSVLSISWGRSEDTWTPQALRVLDGDGEKRPERRIVGRGTRRSAARRGGCRRRPIPRQSSDRAG